MDRIRNTRKLSTLRLSSHKMSSRYPNILNEEDDDNRRAGNPPYHDRVLPMPHQMMARDGLGEFDRLANIRRSTNQANRQTQWQSEQQAQSWTERNADPRDLPLLRATNQSYGQMFSHNPSNNYAQRSTHLVDPWQDSRQTIAVRPPVRQLLGTGNPNWYQNSPRDAQTLRQNNEAARWAAAYETREAGFDITLPPREDTQMSAEQREGKSQAGPSRVNKRKNKATQTSTEQTEDESQAGPSRVNQGKGKATQTSTEPMEGESQAGPSRVNKGKGKARAKKSTK